MRRTVGAEKKFMAAADGGLDQPLAMSFPLQHGQAIVMWSDASLETAHCG